MVKGMGMMESEENDESMDMAMMVVVHSMKDMVNVEIETPERENFGRGE